MAEDPNRPSKHAAYADLFERLLDPTFLIDVVSRKILECNLASERWLVVPRERIVGNKISSWVPEKIREDFEKDLRLSARRYYPRQFDAEFDVEGKHYIVDIQACALELDDDRKVLQVIARDVTAQREIEKQKQELLVRLEKLSTHDEMTGLANFRHFSAQLKQEHQRCARYATPYSLVFMDVDNFKNYNDRNGHPAGDALLKELAQIIQSSCRDTDLAARYGGEEFVVLCPGTPSVGAVTLAERIRARVQAGSFAHAKDQPLGFVSVSLGVAEFPHHGKNTEALLKAADVALYESKHAGRNRVTLATKASKKKAA